MKIQKFNEAYRGKGIDSNRQEIIREIVDCFIDQELLGYEVNGTEYQPNDEILYLEIGDKNDYFSLKLDLSGMGIEIVKREWDEDKEEFYTVRTINNLDSKSAISAKNIRKYNV